MTVSMSTQTAVPSSAKTAAAASAYSAHLTNGDPTLASAAYKPTHPDCFVVKFQPGSYNSCLVTQRRFAKGETLALMDSAQYSSEKRYSTVQVGADEHIELNSDLLYINHSCDPSVRFDVSGPKDSWRAVAERDIDAGEALSFFYPSTEWSMSQPFPCNCSTAKCLGEIAGAKTVPADKLSSYFVNPHILALKEAQQKQA
ncbi:unnamed protein product [Parajaminaea phylloscopi]